MISSNKFDKMLRESCSKSDKRTVVYASREFIKHYTDSLIPDYNYNKNTPRIKSWNGVYIQRCRNYKQLFIKKLRKNKNIKNLRRNKQ